MWLTCLYRVLKSLSLVTILSQMNLVHTVISYFITPVLMLSSQLRLDLPSGLFATFSNFMQRTCSLRLAWAPLNEWRFLSVAVHSLPNLTILSLSGCSKITDDGVELIAENLQKLRSLDLSWCPRITDASLEYIACDLNQLEELTLDR